MTDKYQALREAAQKANPGPHHIFTNPRDDNNWQANDAWHQAADPTLVLALLAERDSLGRMLGAACVDLGSINEALDLDPNDGGAEPILDALGNLKAERQALRDALRAITDQLERVGDTRIHKDGQFIADARAALIWGGAE